MSSNLRQRTKQIPSKDAATPEDFMPQQPIPLWLRGAGAIVALSAVGVTALCYQNPNALSHSEKLTYLAGLALSTIVLTFFFPKISQPLSYHNFADQRQLCCGVPNTFDVLSNVPFLCWGVMGSLLLVIDPMSDKPIVTFLSPTEYYSWMVLFMGSTLTCFGSAYYHWKPCNTRLVWDRLPMTICFMSVYYCVLEERLGRQPAFVLPSLLVIGLLSVVYWHFTDDLRPYALVQFYPLLTLPMLLIIFPPLFTQSHYLFVALGFYALAKVLEILDRQFFALTGKRVSGHTLKHIAASLSMVACAALLVERRPIN